MTGQLFPWAILGTGTILAIIFWWLARSARGEASIDPATGGRRLGYGLPLPLVGLFLGLIVPTTIMALGFSLLPLNGVESILLLIAALMLFLGGGFLFLEGVGVRLVLTPDRLISSTPWRSRRELRWSEIDEVSYSLVNYWLIIRGPKTTIRASLFLQGIGDLAEAIDKHLDPSQVRINRVGVELARKKKVR